ncbi:MAG: hypothetical protein HKN70_11535 [Gammaproteobacteria bacterium]|nr:hypothetical protein [Gammaproteobacteria bacterium]
MQNNSSASPDRDFSCGLEREFAFLLFRSVQVPESFHFVGKEELLAGFTGYAHGPADANDVNWKSVEISTKELLSMDNEIFFWVREARKLVTIDGTRLLIVATFNATSDWSLRVENERGIRSEWYESFVSAEAAIEAAHAAIMEEGVTKFVDIKGFEYLDELPLPQKRAN